MYQGIRVIENFDKWNDWFSKDRGIAISELGEGEFHENMGIVLKTPENSPKTKEHGIVKGSRVVHLRKHFPCGVKALNTEQSIALELLSDSTIPLVTLFGSSGAGKTLLACAHAAHSLKKGLVGKVVIAKSMTPVGKEIGFLKGSLEEKVAPWLGPFFDNFEKCDMPKFYIEKMILEGKIEITPITFIQGRSISNAIVIIDEVQNLTLDIVKQVVTRAADNCKIVLLGDPTQRFEKGAIDLDSLVNKGKNSPLIGHVFLRKSVRSPIAQWAVDNL